MPLPGERSAGELRIAGETCQQRGAHGAGGGPGAAAGRVPGDTLVMGWMEVAAPRSGEDIPVVQVAQGMAGAGEGEGRGVWREVPGSADPV